MKKISVCLMLALCSATLMLGCGQTDTVNKIDENVSEATTDDAEENAEEADNQADNDEESNEDSAEVNDEDNSDDVNEVANEVEEQTQDSLVTASNSKTDNNKTGQKGLQININSMEGVLSEKKDMMFTLTDDAGTAYVFSFEKTPKGYDELADGDRVTVRYIGEQSEIEAFTGKIIDITK